MQRDDCPGWQQAWIEGLGVVQEASYIERQSPKGRRPRPLKDKKGSKCSKAAQSGCLPRQQRGACAQA